MRTLCTHICHRLVLSSSPIVPSIVITSSTSLPLYFSSCGDAPSCSLATPIPSPQLIPFPLPYPFLPFPSSPLHPPSLPQLLPFLTPSIPFLTPHSSTLPFLPFSTTAGDQGPAHKACNLSSRDRQPRSRSPCAPHWSIRNSNSCPQGRNRAPSTSTHPLLHTHASSLLSTHYTFSRYIVHSTFLFL